MPSSVHDGSGARVERMAASGDGTHVATIDADGDVAMWNTGGTEAIAFDPGGGLLAAGGQDRVVRVYRLEDGFGQIAALPGPTGDTHFVAFSPSGDRVVAAGNDGAVYS